MLFKFICRQSRGLIFCLLTNTWLLISLLFRFLLTKPDRLISVPDNTVSAVICFHSLCSSCNVYFTLLEILRVLKPGGKVSSVKIQYLFKCFFAYWGLCTVLHWYDTFCPPFNLLIVFC